MICIYHQHEPGTVQCQRCRIPLCGDCGHDHFCKACRSARDQALGQRAAGSRPARLLPTPSLPSVTRRLVTARAESLVKGRTRNARGKRRDGAMGWTLAGLVAAFLLGRGWPGGKQEPAMPQPPAGAVATATVGIETLEPTPLDVRPAPPIARSAPQETYRESVPQALKPNRSELTADRIQALVDARIAAATRQALAQAQAQKPVEVPSAEPVSGPVAAAAADSASTAATAATPRQMPGSVVLSWPTSGNFLRYTTYVKVQLEHPERYRLVQLAVDGRAVVSETRLSTKLELPLDTTKLDDGPHRLRIYAWTHEGQHRTSETVDVEITNTAADS
ncbi:MAG: hypothetical protein VKO21_08985 [Candidatus Sericytochromatia bacterium]|nr:hypothetical protein [Candidatus Sericytochromatia bacterium]